MPHGISAFAGQLSGITLDFPDLLGLAHPNGLFQRDTLAGKAALKGAKCGYVVPKCFQCF